MNILIACEESQTVCKAFRERGHTAFSCDIQECSGGHPEWHIKGDVLPLLDGWCGFDTIKECGDCPYYDGCKGCVLEGICHIRNKERNYNDGE